MNRVFGILLIIFSFLQSDSYSWDDGGTILGSYGNLGSATNVDDALVLTEDPIDGTPSAYIAAISGLVGGESIEVCIDMYTPDTNVKGRIWGHYYDGSDISSYSGSASGPSEYADSYGDWENLCYTWSVETGQVGFILEARLYSYNEGSPLTVDNLTINISGGTILFPGDIDIVSGCTDSLACNYDSDATSNDGSCLYNDCLDECGGNAELDCLGVCNGVAEFDACGICDGDSLPEDCQNSSLFFSEYAEGSSNNKYLEIYNGGNEVIDLAGYSLSSCSNGCDDSLNWDYPNNVTFQTGTTLSPGDVYVVCHDSADATIQAECDQNFTYLSNGDDVFSLTQVSSGLVLDIIGEIGDDPGDGWEVCGTSNGTKDHTLVRLSSISEGNTDWSVSSNSDTCEWAVLNQNCWSYLGSHPHEDVSSCEGGGSGSEDCSNGIDDDGDGFIDCDDFDCDDDSVCGGGGSCAEYGCVEYTPSNSCQCNDDCDDFGNCCDDYEQICSGEGCTDPLATNYNPNALIDDGTCDYSAPVANAGLDQSVEFSEFVSLSGSGYSANGSIVGYSWSQIGGPSVTLSSYEDQEVSFTAPNEFCTLTFSLMVIDSTANFSSADEISINVGTESIYNVQFTDEQGAYCYETDLAGESVTVTGVVTHVKPGDYPNFFIQDPNDDLWSGIYVYDTSVNPNVGDEITLTATVNEYYSLTQLIDVVSYSLDSENNSINPKYIDASDLGIECSFEGEQYESMLVAIEDIVFESVDEFGNWTVTDGSGTTMIDDYYFDGTFPSLNQGDSYDCITGIVSYSYSEFKVYPRNIDDFSCSNGSCEADGDINEDDSTDVLDIVIIVSSIIEGAELTEDQGCAGDINEDGSVDVLDIVSLVQLILS